MQCNVGKTDRTLRIIAGLLILAAGYYYASWWGLVGLLPLITGITRRCPPYSWLGINTNK